MAKKLIESRKRGLIGWFFLILFWVANALMAYSFFGGLSSVGNRQGVPMSDAEAVGAGIGITFLLIVWAAVAAITGIFAYMTRGRKEIIEIET